MNINILYELLRKLRKFKAGILAVCMLVGAISGEVWLAIGFILLILSADWVVENT